MAKSEMFLYHDIVEWNIEFYDHTYYIKEYKKINEYEKIEI